VELTREWVDEQIALLQKDVNGAYEQYHRLVGALMSLNSIKAKLEEPEKPADPGGEDVSVDS
jgi:hypothetical protein